MSTAENKTTLRRFYNEVMSAGNLDAVDELVAADAIEHEAFPGVEGQGAELVKRLVTTFRTAFPDLRVNVEDMLAEGDKVVARVTLTGTHHGELLGMPPTGRTMSVAAIDIVRMQNGKMVEHWGSTDNLGMMQQLGAIPAQAAP
jgi:steroid delta-isomerase-like uncharacterized protein